MSDQQFAELMQSVPAFAEAIRRHDGGDLAGARMMYTNLVDQPQLTAACLYQLGLIAAAMGEPARAAEMFSQATRLSPTLWSGYENLSAALDRTGCIVEATMALVECGCQQYRSKLYGKAEETFRRALERAPDNYTASANLGTCMAQLDRPKEAVAYLVRALLLYGRSAPEVADFVTELTKIPNTIDPSQIALPPFSPVPGQMERVEETLTSLGKVLCDLGNNQAGLYCHRMAVKMSPGYALGHWNYALTLLTQWNFSLGWTEYEWRWCWPDFPEPNRRLPAAPWQGEDLTGKRILIWCEQGFGDIMQFAPLMKWLKKRYPDAEVQFEVTQPLVRLLKNSMPEIEVLLRADMPGLVRTDKHLDYALPLMSLPYRLQMKPEQLPLATNYLSPCMDDVPAWQKRLEADGLKVGLVWATRPEPDTKRWIPLKKIRPLLAMEGVSWFSLQKGGQESDIAAEQLSELKNLAPYLRDFADTAAAISSLDLVITVDTSVAHLAGGMGKPVWTLVRDAADWRWASDQIQTPWYPNMRLFRQRKGEDWDEVLDRVRVALQEKVAAARNSHTSH